MKLSEKHFKWIMIILSSLGMSVFLWSGITPIGLCLTFFFSTIIFIWYDLVFEEF